MAWLRFLGGGRRRRSVWNNVGDDGVLTAGRLGASLLLGGEIGPRDWAALSEAGVSVVVNMQEEQQDAFAPHEKVDGYLWLPAPDGRAPSVEQLLQGVAFVRAAITADRVVFVHCKAGQGRAPLLCACYLVGEGASVMEAMKRVQDARPSTNLTAEQSARLREFATYLAAQKPSPVPEAAPHVAPEAAAQIASVESAIEGVHTPGEPSESTSSAANATPKNALPSVARSAAAPAAKS